MGHRPRSARFRKPSRVGLCNDAFMEVCHTWDEFFASTSSKGKPPVPTIRDRWEREELEKLRKQRVGLLRELNQARAYSKKLEVKLALKYSLRLIYVLFAIAWAAGWPLIGWWL